MKRTSLSAGLAIAQALREDAEVRGIATKVFPVVADKALLPYVAYRRASMAAVQTKGQGAADTALVEVLCYAKTYEQSVELAEAVRFALDGASGEAAGLAVRSIKLSDAEDYWEAGAFIQRLTFTVRV